MENGNNSFWGFIKSFIGLIIFILLISMYIDELKESYIAKKWFKFIILVSIPVFLFGYVINEHIESEKHSISYVDAQIEFLRRTNK